MTDAAVRSAPPSPLAERFWSIARGQDADGEAVEPVDIVRQVLAILDALHRGERGAPVSVHTLSFLKLLRESEQRGDLSYAAPEQICGEMLDERSLVFSVGVLLFERLTGRHPFGADKSRRVARIRRGEFGSGVNYFPTVPPGLRTILMKAMGPFPEERWSSLAELRAHLEQFVAHEDRPYLPGTSPRPPLPPAKKRPAPSTDVQSTKVVDMSEQVRLERARAEMKARAHRQVSGLIDAGDLGTGDRRPATADRKPETGVASQVPAAPAAVVAPLYQLPEAAVDVRPSRDWMKPLLWAAIGAAAASVVLFMTRGTAGDEPQPAISAAAASSPSSPSLSPSPSALSPSPPPSALPPVPPPAPAPAPARAGFDAHAAGTAAAAIARTCVPQPTLARGLGFGMSLLFDPSTGRVRSVYFAGDEGGLRFTERRCISGRLAGRPLAHAPAPRSIVGYFVRLDAGGATVRVSGQRDGAAGR